MKAPLALFRKLASHPRCCVPVRPPFLNLSSSSSHQLTKRQKDGTYLKQLSETPIRFLSIFECQYNSRTQSTTQQSPLFLSFSEQHMDIY
ncbi:hypothetical protein QN277_021290 [Acacia crassicarpa]|uniref:Uncharacterized protein n=1 Tax=Acacia crassicarpa TaxID=499986 RepID=A0AAE1MSY0_9FABA|nr:hypothetical protein QN277_021290 [Acacia crassicarpa]